MARRKSSDFHREATKDMYELELDSGDVVTFLDPNRLGTESAFDLYRESDPEQVLRALLADQFAAFWREWRDRPADETEALIDEVTDHYGANRGKRRSSRS